MSMNMFNYLNWILAALFILFIVFIHIKSLINHSRVTKATKDAVNCEGFIKNRWSISEILIMAVFIFIVLFGYFYFPARRDYMKIVGIYLGVYILLMIPSYAVDHIKIKVTELGLINFENLIRWEDITSYELLVERWSDNVIIKINFNLKNKATSYRIKVKNTEAQSVINTLKKYNCQLKSA